MIHDYFDPLFPKFIPPYVPPQTGQLTFVIPPMPGTIISAEEIASIKKLISDFREAMEAAKTVDRLTEQPDCVDPEKAKLQDRVIELEKRISSLERVAYLKGKI